MEIQVPPGLLTVSKEVSIRGRHPVDFVEGIGEDRDPRPAAPGSPVLYAGARILN
jgi:hypothetical protein